VVIVGGGFGVTTVHAARLTGSTGHVTVYEASEERFSDLQTAIHLNEVEGRVEAILGVVGEGVKVYGEKTPRETSPEDLPSCDVLELDCEGAETEILQKMKLEPRSILVETHGFRGAPTEEVVTIMEKKGYNVEVIGVAEPRIRNFCIKKDIKVVLGTKDNSS
jgi:hypothetical protein